MDRKVLDMEEDMGCSMVEGILAYSMALEDSMVLGMGYSKDHDPSSSNLPAQML